MELIFFLGILYREIRKIKDERGKKIIVTMYWKCDREGCQILSNFMVCVTVTEFKMQEGEEKHPAASIHEMAVLSFSI